MKRSVIVVGARGYTGAELLPLLYRHPVFQVAAVGSGTAAGQPVSAHVGGMEGSELHFTDIRPRDLGQQQADAVVLALPNGHADPYVNVLDEGRQDVVVVDLSADHRFDSAWAYGQPERFAERISGATRIANPGCYATAAQLALAPLLDRLVGTPATFGVSGYSGAGKSPSRRNDPAALEDNLLPYALVDHLHEKEVSHHIGREIRFLPHVASFFRGISLTVAAELRSAMTERELLALFRAFYAPCPLVEVRERVPEVKEVQGKHRVIIGGFAVSETNPCSISIVAVLDNLLKGAATQAVQNLNLAFGLDAMTGLRPRPGQKA
jgi:N-acetyl-gamma-glutamyl-phosphate reductase